MTARSVEEQRKRNVSLAAAVTLIALTFLFYPGTEGMAWMMWRDAPVLAVSMAVAGLLCARVWWRSGR